jgi:SAM-dependent methyltransferase
MSSLEWLCVACQEALPSVALPGRHTLISYQPQDVTMGEADLRPPSLHEHKCYKVPSAALSLSAGFRAHCLNLPVLDFVTRQRATAVYIDELTGPTVDLSRVLTLFAVPVYLRLQSDPNTLLTGLAVAARRRLEASLKACSGLLADTPEIEQQWRKAFSDLPAFIAAADLVRFGSGSVLQLQRPDDYAIYEFAQRHHPLLVDMQAPDVHHFHGCRHVLDVGCGVGVFLSLLEAGGIPAVGVERNAVLACYGREMGLDIIADDALDYLALQRERFDGIYCGHFVEHLPSEAVAILLQRIHNALLPGGIAVLVFPDPESIRTQLLGFWRDPEHVRFYHPELIVTMAAAIGLHCEWRSYDDEPHDIGAFPRQPPVMPPEPSSETSRLSVWHGILRQLGIATAAEVQALVVQNLALRNRVTALQSRTETLWRVNQTWSWSDNAVLRLRKPV